MSWSRVSNGEMLFHRCTPDLSYTINPMYPWGTSARNSSLTFWTLHHARINWLTRTYTAAKNGQKAQDQHLCESNVPSLVLQFVAGSLSSHDRGEQADFNKQPTSNPRHQRVRTTIRATLIKSGASQFERNTLSKQVYNKLNIPMFEFDHCKIICLHVNQSSSHQSIHRINSSHQSIIITSITKFISCNVPYCTLKKFNS